MKRVLWSARPADPPLCTETPNNNQQSVLLTGYDNLLPVFTLPFHIESEPCCSGVAEDLLSCTSGDLNFDGVVDGKDFVEFRKDFIANQ